MSPTDPIKALLGTMLLIAALLLCLFLSPLQRRGDGAHRKSGPRPSRAARPAFEGGR